MNFPNILPDSQQIALEWNTISYESNYNRVSQVASLLGARWVITATFTNRDGIEAKTLKAFINGLGGKAGTFNYLVADYSPLGTPTGTPLVQGASQLGSSLITDGWTASTRILEAGDYFNVNGELKQIDAPVDSDVSGVATLTFHPPLRQSPPDNSSIEADSPRVTVELISDNNPIDISAPVIHGATLSMREAIRL